MTALCKLPVVIAEPGHPLARRNRALSDVAPQRLLKLADRADGPGRWRLEVHDSGLRGARGEVPMAVDEPGQ